MTAPRTNFSLGGGLTIRDAHMDDPWAWLAAGWRDLWQVPSISLAYGAVFTATGLALTAGLWFLDLMAFMPALAACFMLGGPLMATGLYEVSRRLEAGEEVTWAIVSKVHIASPIQLGLVSFLLMFIILVWMRAATLIYALFTYGVYMPLDRFAAFAIGTWQGMALVATGTAVGAVLAVVTFSVAALSIPILMRHQTDAFTALAASIGAVVRKPGPMLLWAWLIGVLCFFGLATLFIGLIVVFPLLGHATWHAYRSLVRGPEVPAVTPSIAAPEPHKVG